MRAQRESVELHKSDEVVERTLAHRINRLSHEVREIELLADHIYGVLWGERPIYNKDNDAQCSLVDVLDEIETIVLSSYKTLEEISEKLSDSEPLRPSLTKRPE